MDLAERFNEASEALAARGHRVVVRRARGMVGEGAPADAADFLADAGERMRDPSLTGLAEALRGWLDEGGDARLLTSDAAWTAGVHAEEAVARDIGRIVEEQQISALVSQIQPPGLAAPTPTTRVAAHMSPSEMPPLPSRPQVSEPERSEPPRASAAVEAPSRLEERRLNLSDAPSPQPPAADRQAGPGAGAPPGVAPSGPPLSLEIVDEAALADSEGPAAVQPSPAAASSPARQPAPSDAIMKTGFENLPQLDAPPSLDDVKPPEKDAKGGSGAAYALLVVVLAGAAAAYWYLFLRPAG